MITQNKVEKVVVLYKDRLLRFGFELVEYVANLYDCKIEVIDTTDNKYWYLSVGIEVEEKQEQLTDVSLGIDLGVSELGICSDGVKYKNINKTRLVKKLEKKLRRLQRQVSKKYLINKEGSKFVKTSNIIKLEKKYNYYTGNSQISERIIFT